MVTKVVVVMIMTIEVVIYVVVTVMVGRTSIPSSLTGSSIH